MTKTPSDPTVTFAGKIAETVTSVAKLMLQSRPVPAYPQAQEGKELIVMGNGPSLRKTIDTQLERLCSSDTLAVNFAANTPELKQIKPKFYVLADPVFFDKNAEGNVASLRENISAVDWDMTLFIPRGRVFETTNPHLNVLPFNMVGTEGSEALENFAFDRRLGMPRPRNVLIPALMIGCWMNYKTISVVGADHSWMETLKVDSENRVISVQPHFYSDNESEKQRVAQVYSGVKLHHIIHSFYVAFRAYHSINRFAMRKGIKIINQTPDSFIDAFSRK